MDTNIFFLSLLVGLIFMGMVIHWLLEQAKWQLQISINKNFAESLEHIKGILEHK
jgi:hypothetical protein